MVRVSLKTRSRDVARIRRDALAEADEHYWASLSDAPSGSHHDIHALQRAVAERRYRAASRRAMARGFVYMPSADLAELVDLSDIISRLRLVDAQDRGKPRKAERHEAEALLGGVAPPDVTLSDAFEIYCRDIAVGDLVNKSPNQKRLWLKTKKRAVQSFMSLVGDLPMRGIERKHALTFYTWWKDRLMPKPGGKACKPNTANRDLGNLRKLYAVYFRHVGEEERQNPFRNLNFQDGFASEVPPFEDDWVRSKILVPGVFDSLNR